MAVNLPIYMDNLATTRVDPRVLETMLPYFTETYGNAASRNHSFGWSADEAVEQARAQLAALMNATPREIAFTSGATESDNLAIKGVAEMYREQGNHIVTSQIEHKAVLDTCKRLEQWGFEVTYLPVGKLGVVSAAQVAAALTDKTILVSIMFANNEIGSVNPIAEIGAVCHEKGVLFHTDATQGYGKIPFDVQAMNVDLASVSAHKMYGPKGVGALYTRARRPRVRIAAQMDGGGHERGRRSGTLNVPAFVGFGRAAELCAETMEAETKRLGGLRDKLESYILAHLDEVYLNGDPDHRLPNVSNLSFAYVEGESMMMGMSEIAVSSGSACTSASLEPSYVLRALGVGDDLAHSSIRYGLGRFTTEEEIDYVGETTVETVNRLREMSPLYEMAKEGVDLSTVQWAVH